MGKVKLTREQARAIEKESYRDYENILYDYLVVSDYDEKFKGLTFGGLYRALHQGYEVEETFEVGDCVVLDDGQIVEIIEEDFTFIVGWIANRSMYRDRVSENRIKRHATKQEKWWAKHGRGVWELKLNDEIRNKESDRRFDVVHIFDNGDINLERTSANDYMQKEVMTVKRTNINNYHYEIICFAEDRKDVDHD